MSTLTVAESELSREDRGIHPLFQTLSLYRNNPSSASEQPLDKNMLSTSSNYAPHSETQVQAVKDSVGLTPLSRILEGTFYGLV